MINTKTITLAMGMILTVCILTSSCTKERNIEVTVIKDCTGAYLRMNSKDYHICNPEKAASFPSGSTVTATFKKVKECNGSAKNVSVCYLLHLNEGWIKVDRIKNK